MSKPEITIVVANYNHAQFLENSVNSVVNQTFDNIEIIVVDDCSTDNSKDIIESLSKTDDRIKTIYLPENRGKWFALNTAISQANGKLITLNDADDASCPDRLKRQLSVLKTMGSYHNLCGFSHCYSENDMSKALKYRNESADVNIVEHDEVTKLVHKGWKTNGINHYYMGNYEVHGATCLFYKQLWDHGMKFLPGNMGLRCQKAEDSDFNTKMTLLLQKTSVLKEPLYCYRRHTSTNPAYLENL